MQAIVLFDADCGFCNWSLRRVLSLDRHGKLRPVAIQSEEGQRLLADMEVDKRLASAHVALPDGRILSGGAAAPELFRRLPRGRWLAQLTERFPGATDRAYRLIAGHRSFFGSTLKLRAGPPGPNRANLPRGQ